MNANSVIGKNTEQVALMAIRSLLDREEWSIDLLWPIDASLTEIGYPSAPPAPDAGDAE